MTIVVSGKDQRLAVVASGKVTNVYVISTAKAGMGEGLDSGQTPRGKHVVAEKIGGYAPEGLVFVDRLPTSEIMKEYTPGRWPVTTRILRLNGLEESNSNTFERLIYIHGSPVEHLLGKPASGGCIRMRASDVIALFDKVRVGTVINMFESTLDEALDLLQLAQRGTAHVAPNPLH